MVKVKFLGTSFRNKLAAFWKENDLELGSTVKLACADDKTQSCLNMVLFGKTGSGKSASGNTILGRDAFISKKSATSLTQDVEVEYGNVGDLPVAVYDTPGFFNLDLSEDEVQEKCQRVISRCESGPCIFLLVIKADRFTGEEKKAVEKIEELLGVKHQENTWILFTRGDELGEENKTIKDFLNGTPDLKKLVEKYKNRYHVFNNKEIKKEKKDVTEQVTNLIRKTFPQKDQSTAVIRQKENPSERRIVLLGKTGVGKSATGNSILGEKKFISKLSFSSVTAHSEKEEVEVAGKKVFVVDTPGLFDTSYSNEDIAKELGRSVFLSSPGPHALLYVLRLDLFTKQEENVVELYGKLFGEEMRKYMMILFTCGDQLEGENIDEMIKENEPLSRLVDQCGGGYHVFNNKDLSNREQVNKLMEKIDRMVVKNGGTYYTSSQMQTGDK